MAVHACNSSTAEDNEFKASLDCTKRPCLKKENTNILLKKKIERHTNVQKHMKRYSTSLLIRKMMRCHLKH
jgi:hypothetical protein